MKIEDGGVTENIRDKKIHTIRVHFESGRKINLWINDSLSYLTISEALELKQEIQKALNNAVNI